MKKVFLITILFAQGALAQNYGALGGACASQGAWTQRALEQTRNISLAISQLQDNAACKGIEQIFSLVQKTSEVLEKEGGGDMPSDRLEAVPGRQAALQQFMSSTDPQYKSSMLNALMKETITGAVLATRKASLGGLLAYRLQQPNYNPSAAFDTALNSFQQITAFLPRYDQCLIGRPGPAGAILGSLVNMAASFASSGQGLSQKFGISVQSLLNMVQKQKFSGALRLLNQAEFVNSMACLLETTSESYCAVEDAHHLLESGVLEYNPTFSADNVSMNLEHPLAGYYILVHHLPNVARWIQDVQNGVPPQWSTDAQFKVTNNTNVINFQHTKWKIQGKFNEDMKLYRSDLPLLTRQNTILAALENVVNSLRGGAGVTEELRLDSVNFVTLSINPKAIPFRLIGMGNRVPPTVSQNLPGRVMLDWLDYVKGQNGNFTATKDEDNEGVLKFANTDELKKAIEINLEEILKEAEKKASDFYRERIIVNQVILVSKSLVSQTYAVYDSLRLIYKYLNYFENLITRSPNFQPASKEAKLLLAARDTKKRMGLVLKAYEELNPLLELDPEITDYSSRIEAAFKNVVKTVYDQFDVMWQRDSFLTGNLSNFIYADYVFKTKNGINFRQYEQDLLLSSGQDMLKYISAVHGLNPTALKNDLGRANSTNASNIGATQMILQDFLETTLDLYTRIINRQDTSDVGTAKSSFKRLWNDSVINGRGQSENKISMFFSNVFGVIGNMVVRDSYRPDLYPMRLSPLDTENPMRDTKYGDFANFRAQLCMLSLSMSYKYKDKDRLAPYCKGVILESTYKNADPRFPLNASYDAILNLPQNGDYEEKTVCAFRDYNRRNLVYWLTQNLQNEK